jgi:hypothetical protein
VPIVSVLDCQSKGEAVPVHEEPTSLEEALKVVRRLTAENARLREQLLAHQSPPLPEGDGIDVSDPRNEGVGRPSDPASKLALFQSLFRGRDDVYASRWERDGRGGYAPALRPGAPRGRHQVREAADYLPLTPDVVRQHLTGSCTLGIYPLLRDDTCWFLAIDFDKEGWHQDALAALNASDELEIPAALERSRSGNGAHLWVFFSEPVAASTARSLGSAILTRALDRRYQIGLDSYDRLFPSQDTLPKGGFGNLIAVPLQRASRRGGNTVFLDRSLEPFEDQWGFLSSIRKLEPAEVERIVGQVARSGAVVAAGASWADGNEEKTPWKLSPSRRPSDATVPGPLPERMKLVLANRLFVEKRDLPPVLLNRLRRLAAFQNPEFFRAQQMRLSTFGKPRLIDCSEDMPAHLTLPRGCLGAVHALGEANGIAVSLTDERCAGSTITVAFRGELTSKQQEAAEGLAAHDAGVLCAPTGFGNTVIAAWLIAQRGVSTLVVVHRQHLADQWRERLAMFLDIEPSAIGQLGAGKRRPTGFVDIALLQSLARKGEVADLVADYGQVIVDECHHVPAFSFERALGEVHARYVVGLTATPIRKDGHHPIIAMQCGPVRFKVDARQGGRGEAVRPSRRVEEHEISASAARPRARHSGDLHPSLLPTRTGRH